MCLQPEQNFSIHLREGAQKVTVGEDVYMAPYLVNLLDPYMCRELQSRGVDCSSLAHSRKMDPIYIWQPFYAKTSGGEHLQALPKQTVLAANLFTPLIEEQMLIVNKEASGNEFVVWSKIIFDLRKNKKYLDAIKMKIASSLKKRLFLSDVEVGESFIGAEQGISPFPIYDASEVQLYKKWYDRGVFHGGFEVCNNMGLNEQLRVQKNILKGLTEESERDRQIYA